MMGILKAILLPVRVILKPFRALLRAVLKIVAEEALEECRRTSPPRLFRKVLDRGQAPGSSILDQAFRDACRDLSAAHTAGEEDGGDDGPAGAGH